MNGIARERQVAQLLRDEGYLVSSRRHEPGPGDLLAIDTTGQGHLIEVKATRRPFERFGPADRTELYETARDYGLWAWLYHWPANGKLRRWCDDEWPEAKVAA